MKRFGREFRIVAGIHVVLILVACSRLDTINDEVNGYPYRADTEAENAGPPTRMSPSIGGDCEDYAWNKCPRLAEAFPSSKIYYLYQAKTQNRYGVAHAAIMINGKVLDNMQPRPYTFNKSDWLAYADWSDCRQLHVKHLGIKPISKLSLVN